MKQSIGIATHLPTLGPDLRPRAARRRLVVITYIAYILLITAMMLSQAVYSPFITRASLTIFGGVVAIGWWKLNQFAQSYVVSSAHRIVDERERSVRDRAFSRAYQVVCSAVALGLIYGMIATSADAHLWIPRTMDDFHSLLWVFLILSVTLPHALIAWWEPDLLDEHDLP
jgi:MFS family permease